MKYELAKELKDAGFPQEVYSGTRFYPYPDSNERIWGDDDTPAIVPNGREWLFRGI